MLCLHCQCFQYTAHNGFSSIDWLCFHADQPHHFLQSDSSQQAAQLQEEDQEEEEFDPYAPLDPHIKGTLPIKPFKKGKKPTRWKRPKQAGCLDVAALGESLFLLMHVAVHVHQQSSHKSICASARDGVQH